MSIRAIGVLFVFGTAALSQVFANTQSPLILTEAPHGLGKAGAGRDLLDQVYPSGTRIVLLKPPYAPDHAEVLSKGLANAANPVVSYDGQRVFFCGKSAADSEWQIFECGLNGGHPRQVTSIRGGAVHPALLPDSSVVFVSPAPGANGNVPPQLFVQSPGSKPSKLTFTTRSATDPAVLTDGRILFVSPNPNPNSGTGLFTINNDGTEITAFAAQHDTPASITRPRLLPDKRVVFMSSTTSGTQAEFVSMARPFASRSRLLGPASVVSSVAPFGESNLLICAQTQPEPEASFACFNLTPQSNTLSNPLISIPGWDCLEAVEAGAPPRPMGRLSNMDPAKHTGQILCLDINDTTAKPANEHAPKATRVRITIACGPDSCGVLGEVAVQEDGSFMAEVPADMPLGFEALDAQGQVLRREAPSLWVRPGENRSCVGCHATHNRAPHNHRPIAVKVPVPKLTEPNISAQTLADHAH